MRREISRYGLLAALLALTLLSCGDARLVEEPETDRETTTPGTDDQDEDNHLAEDGNWYAGWAYPLSEELTEVATVAENQVIVPRDEIFDTELQLLEPMDIIAGASAENGFLKRVIGVERGENQWTIDVVDASLTDVFIEGNFRLDTPPDRRDALRSQDVDGSGLRTTRQGLESEDYEESTVDGCNSECSSDQESEGEDEAGVEYSVSWNPNIELYEDVPVKLRTVLEFDSVPDVPDEYEEICQDFSEEMKALRDANADIARAQRNRRPDEVEEAREELREAAIDLLEWGVENLGHTPFPPFEPEDNATNVRVASELTGAACPDNGSNTELRRFYEDSFLSLSLAYGDECWEGWDSNRFFVREVASDDQDYGLFDVPEKGGDLIGREAKYREDGLVYYAMQPSFIDATRKVSRLMRSRGRLSEALRGGFPPELLSQSSQILDGEPVRHAGKQFVDVAIKQLERGTERPLSRLVDPDELEAGSLLQSRLRDIRQRGVTGDDAWLWGGFSALKLYCKGGVANNATMGGGLQLEFTHEPEIVFKAAKGAKIDKEVEVAKVSKAFAIGPIPVYLELFLKAKMNAAANASLEVSVKLRKHRGVIDFFYGMRKRGGDYDVIDLRDYEDAQRANRFLFLEDPDRARDDAELYRSQNDLFTVGVSVEGSVGFQIGLNVELVLYKLFGVGFGANFGTNVVGKGTADTSGAAELSLDFTQGPTADLTASLKLPLCPAEGSCKEVEEMVDGLCKIPPWNGTVCNNGSSFCKKRPYLCPQFDPSGKQTGISLPMFNSCQFVPWSNPRPLCDNEPFDHVPRAIPPCIKACYRLNANTWNNAIALVRAGDTYPCEHSWAGRGDETQGYAVDSLIIEKDGGGFSTAKAFRLDGEPVDSIWRNKMRPCYSTSRPVCDRDVNQCDALVLQERALHFKDALVVEFTDDFSDGDLLRIAQQEIGVTADSDFEGFCGLNEPFEVWIGTGIEDDDSWVKIGTTNENNLVHSFRLDTFASDDDRTETTDLETQPPWGCVE